MTGAVQVAGPRLAWPRPVPGGPSRPDERRVIRAAAVQCPFLAPSMERIETSANLGHGRCCWTPLYTVEPNGIAN